MQVKFEEEVWGRLNATLHKICLSQELLLER